MQCKHLYRKDCLDRWLEYLTAACPLCQKLVLPEIVVIEYPRTQSDQEYQSRGEELVSLLSARGCGSTLGSHR